MPIRTGSPAYSTLAFTSSLGGVGGIDGFTFTSRGSAKPSDTLTAGTFAGLQRSVNYLLKNYPVTAATLTIDGLIGKSTLASTQAVVSYMNGFGAQKLEVPGSIRSLASAAESYMMAIAQFTTERTKTNPPPGTTKPSELPPETLPTDEEVERVDADAIAETLAPSSFGGGGMIGVVMLAVGGFLWWKQSKGKTQRRPAKRRTRKIRARRAAPRKARRRRRS